MFRKRSTSIYLFSAITSILCEAEATNQKAGYAQDNPPPVRVYTTQYLNGNKPVIDGVLNDDCWHAGTWAGDFTQWIPDDGKAPSQPTYFQIQYDKDNIYVAIRAVDKEPEKIKRKRGRRDEMTGDVVGICFDSYHDRRTGFEFDVTAAGQKYDAILTNPANGDENWNAVWYAKVAMEDSAWTAELQIPLSQLRYSNKNEQIWGLHVWRWIDRLREESDWEIQTSTGPGMLYLFGELHGLKGLNKSRKAEIIVSGLGKVNTFRKDADNPFAKKGYIVNGNTGVDGKIGLSSNLTLDFTINPDFGQVEADPSEMNLTAFETFYDEKRPFFLEGANIFGFDVDDVSLFYSRRIGHAPSYSPPLAEGEYLQSPENTTILDAEKLSGKTAKGLSIGLLHSLTSSEQAEIASSSGRNNITVEPLTNYLVARVQQDFKQGNTVLGAMLTSTNRFNQDTHLEFLNHTALSGGIDFLHQWKSKKYYVDAKLLGSYVSGESQAIRKLQLSSARYYQRPDASHLIYDTAATNLSGMGGKIKVGKGKGLWRYFTDVTFRSPGLELNDVGYMQTADLIKQNAGISYFVNRPVSVFRTYNASLQQNNNWNFGGRYLSSGLTGNVYFEFRSRWGITTNMNYTSRALDTRLLRGGYAILVPAIWKGYVTLKSDQSKSIAGSFKYTQTWMNERGYSSAYNPSLTFRPVNELKLSLNMTYTTGQDNMQYLKTASVNGVKQSILACLDQKTINAVFRVDYNITPEFSIQYYASPYASSGRYSDFKVVTTPDAGNYYDRFSLLDNFTYQDDKYQFDMNQDAKSDLTVNNPDFNYYQFRSNFVVRWEYMPGSQLYFVWANEKTNYINPAYGSITNIFDGFSGGTSNNIFLVKFSYWFSI